MRILGAIPGRAVSPLLALAAISIAACGSGAAPTPHTTAPASTAGPPSPAGTATTALPGAGKPPVTIGDKNFTEQFVLGSLYEQALVAQGYTVSLNRNIGPTEVTIQALTSGRLDMYPEYLDTWDSAVAGYRHAFHSRRSAYQAGQRYALGQGLQLLDPSPLTNTAAIAVKRDYATRHGLRTLQDLRTVAATLTLGGPPQFQQDPAQLPAIEQAYGFVPATYQPLGVGAQYQALDQGSVQAAEVNTTDAQLSTGPYAVLSDPRRAFGWGNVVPVVSARMMLAEGPQFASTIDRVTALLSTAVMRRLNAAVDIGHQDPATVAKQFLQAQGLVAPPRP